MYVMNELHVLLLYGDSLGMDHCHVYHYNID